MCSLSLPHWVITNISFGKQALASQFLRECGEIKSFLSARRGHPSSLLALLSQSQLTASAPGKEIKAVHTIMKSKLKMLTVTHPTYGNHKNKLNEC